MISTIQNSKSKIQNSPTPRYRFAPSPTGYLHLGGARTAILNWLLARHAGGELVLRIEDTDVERNVAGAEAELLDDLRWLGLDWDEGPDVGGPHAPYRQSERSAIYADHARQLLASGSAYPCTCPPAQEVGGEQRRRCPCADRAATSLSPGASLRFRVPQRPEVGFRDLIRGDIVYPAESVEDFVLVRADGRPTYNFAAAVDDVTMRITHVIRGADHIANTPKQVLVLEAFGWQLPSIAHIPLILGPDRQKLSKRHGATSIAEHRRQGYMPQALVNYLSLLSWSSPSGEELLPISRLVEEVDLSRVGASDAVFDREKLRWLSSRYIHALSTDELAERIEPFLRPERPAIARERFPTAVEVIRERISILAEAPAELRHFLGPQTPEEEQARAAVLSQTEGRAVIDVVRARLAMLEEWSVEAVGRAIREAGKDSGVRGKQLFQPLRLALSGHEHGPDLAKVVYVMGRDRALALLSAGGGGI